MSYEQTVTITNERDHSVELIIEPWGMVLDFPSQASYEIIASASIQGEVEIEYDDENFIIWGWPTSIITVKRGGEEIYQGALPVPNVPDGQSVSTFLKSILGPKEAGK